MRDRLTPLTIPSRTGRLAIVTGANSGIGKATARALGLAGADSLAGGTIPKMAELSEPPVPEFFVGKRPVPADAPA